MRGSCAMFSNVWFCTKSLATGAPPSRGRDNDQEGFRVGGKGVRRQQMPIIRPTALVQGPYGLPSGTSMAVNPPQGFSPHPVPFTLNSPSLTITKPHLPRDPMAAPLANVISSGNANTGSL
jgi:hypothetical protein